MTNQNNFSLRFQLRRLKGSDASWRHDIEAPEGHRDFSDDEEERKRRKDKRDERKVLLGIADSVNGKNPAEGQR